MASEQAKKLAASTTFEIDPDAQPYKPGFWAVDYDPAQATWGDTEEELGGFDVNFREKIGGTDYQQWDTGAEDVPNVVPAWGSQIHRGSAFGEKPTWGSGIDYDPSKKHTITNVTTGKERPSFLNVTALPDATDTSTEVKSGEMSNWKVNAEKALQDMIKIEETDPTSLIQTVGDEGVVSQEESESMIAASKQGTHSKVNINNIIAIGAHGTLKSKRHPDAYRGGKGVDIIEGALSTFLREPSANANAQGEVTSYNTPRWLDYGGLRMSGPEFMDASVEQDYEEGGVKKTRTVPTTSGIMPHGITDEGKSIHYSGLYRGKGEKGQVGEDTLWISERADHGGLIGTEPKHPGDTAYHEPIHRFFHYLWRDYYDNEGKLSKGIKVRDAENKEVELLDLIFPKKDPNCTANVCSRNWNGKAMHDMIYSASKYSSMRKRVGTDEFGEQTSMTQTGNMLRNWDNLRKINRAMSYESQRILRLKNIPAPEWVNPDA